MSRFEIKMPKLGESITEGTIISWSVKIGDVIEEDDTLFEVETVKVSAEIPSPVAGTILEILYKEGDTVSVGTVVAIVGIEGEGENEAPAAPSAEVAAPKNEEAPTPSVAPVAAPAEIPAKTTSEPTANLKKGDDSKWLSPVVLELVKSAKLTTEELDTIVGTGYIGRLTRKDVLNYIDVKAGNKQKTSPAPAEPHTEPQSGSTAEPAKTPIVRKDSDTVIEMNTIRRVTSERMVMSKKTSAHVTTVIEVDVTKLVQWRSKTKDKFQDHEGISLTYMPAIAEATAKALIEFPEINASADGTRIIQKKDINIGIAVALEGWNLIVPVIHGADKLNISGLAHAIDDLANKARNSKLKISDIEGGTFTITNFGSFKNIFGTPIINQPEVAILGVGYIEKKPSVISTPEGDTIGIRHKMYLSLSYDHRIVDGALGGAFLLRIANLLENWTTNI